MRQLNALSSVRFNLDSVWGRILRSSQLVAIQLVWAYFKAVETLVRRVYPLATPDGHDPTVESRSKLCDEPMPASDRNPPVWFG